ncbi:MAG TPA: class I SAM-dependent methyltransferase, partial [Thermoanaerobacterales bacterium]|nr:class I SAM-dependent methyltransferase [Thermoanaerobacterales bacterium]
MEIDFAKLWERDKKNKKNQQKFWDSRAQEFNSRLSENSSPKETKKVIDYLVQKGALKTDGSVLDIGCGPGKYALAFAKKVKKITGIDISPKMIAFAKENARNGGFDNTEFVQASWPEADLSALGWIENYDLVYAAFSPGIDSPNALKKMIQASRKHCFISGFVTREDRVLDGLKRHLGIKITPWGRQIYYSFNLLWNWGYYPEITYHD